MRFDGDLREEYLKRVRKLTLRGVSAFEENVDSEGNIFGTKNKALAVAQNLFSAQTSIAQEKLELWESYFQWIATRRVVIVK